MESTFTFNGSYSSLQDFAKSVGSILTGNKVEVHSANVKGTVLRGEVEAGLSIIEWNLSVLTDYVFLNNFHSFEGEKFYLLTYYYDPDYDSIEYNDGLHQVYRDKIPFLLAMSGSANIKFHYKAGSHIRCTCLALTHAWLLQQLVNVKEEKFVAEEMPRLLQSIQIRPLSKVEIVYSTGLSKEFTQASRALYLKLHIFNLLSFLYRHASIQSHKTNQNNAAQDEMILEVEKDLVAHLTATMPSVDSLAAKYFLSVSTLTRRFKAVFGIGPSAYYIGKKMALAKEMLNQGKTVNEVATLLKYESVSHFISMFKKEYGHSPGKEKSKA